MSARAPRLLTFAGRHGPDTVLNLGRSNSESKVTMIADIGSPRKSSAARGLLALLVRTSRQLSFGLLLTTTIAVGATVQADDDTLMAGRGKVNFPVSCDADLQPRFDAALAALHSFWYKEALKEFTALSEADPNCAMSYWGMAMSRWNELWAAATR
jgi:hypothetical protein